jgi:DNA-binding MarR family transcriptional regulator
MEADTDTLARLAGALRHARDELSPDVTAQRLLILVSVGLHEGLSQNELREHLPATSVTALSRNLADLSACTSRKTPGPGLVELRTDPNNLRKKRIYLTRLGKRFLANWCRSF